MPHRTSTGFRGNGSSEWWPFQGQRSHGLRCCPPNERTILGFRLRDRAHQSRSTGAVRSTVAVWAMVTSQFRGAFHLGPIPTPATDCALHRGASETLLHVAWTSAVSPNVAGKNHCAASSRLEPSRPSSQAGCPWLARPTIDAPLGAKNGVRGFLVERRNR